MMRERDMTLGMDEPERIKDLNSLDVSDILNVVGADFH